METEGTCKICLRYFVNYCQVNDLEYQKSIIETGNSHLFDELVVWSKLNVEELLPFCHYCIESLEKIKSLSTDCSKLEKKIDITVSTLTMASLRCRKAIKSRGNLLAYGSGNGKMCIKIEEGTKVNSNCVLCYNFYLEGKTTPRFWSREQKLKILKSCKRHIMQPIRNNECGFDWEMLPEQIFSPFCQNCLISIWELNSLNLKLEKAEESFKSYINEFTMESLKYKTKNLLKIDSDSEKQEMKEEIADNSALDFNAKSQFPNYVSDEEETDIVLYDPIVMDANFNSRKVKSTDSTTPSRTVVSTSFARHPMATFSDASVPNEPRQESSAIQSGSEDHFHYAYNETEEPINMTKGTIYEQNVVHSMLPPEQQNSSSKMCLRSSARQKNMSRCPNCKKTFAKNIGLASHMATCGSYVGNSSPKKMKHTKFNGLQKPPGTVIKLAPETIRFTCTVPGCGNKFDLRRRLNLHMEFHNAKK